MSSISSSLRLFSPTPPQPLIKPFSISFNPPFFFYKPLLLISPISFQRLPKPIEAQPQQQEQSFTQVDPTLLPPKLQEIISLFQSVPDPKSKYHQLLHYSTQLPPFDSQFKTDDHRVRGCVSQVWVRAFLDPNDPSKVRFEADSDSALTKGLAALLVFGLSGALANEIAGVPPEFVHLLGLRQSLTPSRNNGFLNMLRLMQQKALQIVGLDLNGKDGILEGEKLNFGGKIGGFGGNLETEEISGANGEEVPVNYGGVSGIGESSLSAKDGILKEENSNLGEKTDVFDGNSEIDEVSTHGNLENDNVSSANGHEVSVLEGKDVSFDQNSSEKDRDSVINRVLEAKGDDEDGVFGGRRERMRERLEKELSPVEVEVEDISHLHAGHAGVRGSNGGETHFNVRVISKEFEGKSMVKRHRLVYDILKEELQSGLHALSIVAKTPSEVQPS